MVNFMTLRHSVKISDSQEGLFGNGSSNGRRECLCALKSEIQYCPLCQPSNKCLKGVANKNLLFSLLQGAI